MGTPAAYHPLAPRPDPRLLSVVVPVYNESAVLPLFRQALTAFLATLDNAAAEVVLVNDGSTDDSLRHLLDWAASDGRVRVVGLARNFGHQAAVTAGLDAARGDAVVVMDADLQDPPAVVLDMLREYRAGYDVVYGRRVNRAGETPFKRLSAWAFYRLMQRFVHQSLPIDAGDFRLISRPCLDAVRSMRETHRFLRGMVAWVGFAQTAVPFERPPRAAGTTKFPVRHMARFAWTAALSFSPAPLRVSFALAVLVAAVGMAEAAYAVIRVLLGLHVEPGWTSLLIVVCLIGAAVLLSIGVLGEYVARIFEQVKGRPLYVVSVTSDGRPLDERAAGVSVEGVSVGGATVGGATAAPSDGRGVGVSRVGPTNADSALEPVPDVRMWVGEGVAVMLKSATSFDDPVEISEDEAEAAIAALQSTLDRLRARHAVGPPDRA